VAVLVVLAVAAVELILLAVLDILLAEPVVLVEVVEADITPSTRALLVAMGVTVVEEELINTVAAE
jgi:hypothetical protein